MEYALFEEREGSTAPSSLVLEGHYFPLFSLRSTQMNLENMVKTDSNSNCFIENN